MRCSRVGHLLPAYLDGDLVGRLNQGISDHLDACEHCRRELAAQQRVHRILDTGRPPVTIDLWADFSRRLQAQSPPQPSPWRTLWQPGLATALATAVVALVVRTAALPAFTPTSAGPYDRAAQVTRERASGSGDEKAVRRTMPAQRPGAGPDSRLVVAHLPKPDRARQRLRAKRPVLIADQTTSRRWQRVARRFEPARTSMPHSRSLDPSIWPTAATYPASADPPTVSSHAPQPRSQPNAAHSRAGDPLQIAEALASVQQDAASDQMGGELLRLAREVAAVGGEPVTGGRSGIESVSPAAESSAATGT